MGVGSVDMPHPGRGSAELRGRVPRAVPVNKAIMGNWVKLIRSASKSREFSGKQMRNTEYSAHPRTALGNYREQGTGN